jgi:hypothetical protein
MQSQDGAAGRAFTKSRNKRVQQGRQRRAEQAETYRQGHTLMDEIAFPNTVRVGEKELLKHGCSRLSTIQIYCFIAANVSHILA